MTVAKAYLFANGWVIAFGQDWKVIPEYEGPDTDILPKLRRDYPELVIQQASWVDYRDAPPDAAPERWQRKIPKLLQLLRPSKIEIVIYLVIGLCCLIALRSR